MKWCFAILLFLSNALIAQDAVHARLTGYLIKHSYSYFEKIQTYWLLLEDTGSSSSGRRIVLGEKRYSLIQLDVPTVPEMYAYCILKKKMLPIGEVPYDTSNDTGWTNLVERYDELFFKGYEYKLSRKKEFKLTRNILIDTVSYQFDYGVYKINLDYCTCFNKRLIGFGRDSIVGVVRSINRYFRLRSKERRLFERQSYDLFEFLRSKDFHLASGKSGSLGE